jgi:hypothetical protein
LTGPPCKIKVRWEPEIDTVFWKAPGKGPFKNEERTFGSLDFIAQVTLHIPPKGKHLVRRYGLYSSRTRGTWKDRPRVKGRARDEAPIEVSTRTRKKAWARLLAKVYEVDPFLCSRCFGRMSVITPFSTFRLRESGNSFVPFESR